MSLGSPPREYLMEDPKEDLNDYSIVYKLNEIKNILNKYLVSGPPTTESSFEIRGSIHSE